MSNDPKILVEFKPWEAVFILDRLHEEWNRQVMSYALVGDKPRYDSHVWAWRKHTASRLLHMIDDASERQGFGFL